MNFDPTLDNQQPRSLPSRKIEPKPLYDYRIELEFDLGEHDPPRGIRYHRVHLSMSANLGCQDMFFTLERACKRVYPSYPVKVTCQRTKHIGGPENLESFLQGMDLGE